MYSLWYTISAFTVLLHSIFLRHLCLARRGTLETYLLRGHGPIVCFMDYMRLGFGVQVIGLRYSIEVVIVHDQSQHANISLSDLQQGIIAHNANQVLGNPWSVRW